MRNRVLITAERKLLDSFPIISTFYAMINLELHFPILIIDTGTTGQVGLCKIYFCSVMIERARTFMILSADIGRKANHLRCGSIGRYIRIHQIKISPSRFWIEETVFLARLDEDYAFSIIGWRKFDRFGIRIFQRGEYCFFLVTKQYRILAIAEATG